MKLPKTNFLKKIILPFCPVGTLTQRYVEHDLLSPDVLLAFTDWLLLSWALSTT